MNDQNRQKAMRMLSMYERLNKGHSLNKQHEAEHFGVTSKTIQRDLEDLRQYLADTNGGEVSQYIVFNRKSNGYVLQWESRSWLTNKEILAVSRVLLESRAFAKEEMENLLDKISLQCLPRDSKQIQDIIRNEWYHYMPLQHGQPLLQRIWELSQAVREQKLVELEYRRVGAVEPVARIIEPLGVIFAEYYFYLIATIHGQEYEFPAIYRLDRMKRCMALNEHFRVSYTDRFEEGEFRKRVHFMKAGRIMKIRFKFWGESLEAVLDRLPTAQILENDGKIAVVEAEVFGKGIKMWLLSQAQYLEVLEPAEFRQEMCETVQAMMGNYGV